MHKSVHIVCSYSTVKYGKMINTEAALYIIEKEGIFIIIVLYTPDTHSVIWGLWGVDKRFVLLMVLEYC